MSKNAPQHKEKKHVNCVVKLNVICISSILYRFSLAYKCKCAIKLTEDGLIFDCIFLFH